MKRRFEAGEFVWFKWYNTPHPVAGVILMSFWEGEGMPFYRIQGALEYYNGVIDPRIIRKMEAHEIMRYKLMGLFQIIGEITSPLGVLPSHLPLPS